MENNCNFWPFNLGGKKMANTNNKKMNLELASKMAQVEFDYVEVKASAFLLFNYML